MASTYSTNLRVELMADGENSNTWGSKANTNLTLLEQAVSGVASVTMTDADYTLTTSNAATDEARNMVVTMIGTISQARNVIVPSVDKVYVIKNSTTGGFAITVKTSGGTGISVANGETEVVYCDATNVLRASTTPTGTGAPVRSNSPTLVNPALGTPSNGTLTNCTGLPTAGLVDDAVTYAKMQNVSDTDKILGRSTAGAGNVEEITCTAFARSILDDANEAAFKATVNLEAGVDFIGYVAPSTSGNILTSNGSAWTSAAPASGALVNDFRLTLTSGVPVTTSDVTGATTIYCTPYTGNQISLYSGSAWVTRSSAQFSLALGTLTSGKPYDVFCYDNAGTPTLEFLAWTNDTTRATALAYQDGVLCKSGALTRRYLGTFYTTATTTTEDSASKRYLFNYSNRVKRYLERKETTTQWTYTTATWRQANGAAANQVNFFIGVLEDEVSANLVGGGFGTSGIVFSGAIGVNSTSAPSGIYGNVSSTSEVQIAATWRGVPTLGLNYLAMLEWSRASGTTTFLGANNSATAQTASGINAEILA